MFKKIISTSILSVSALAIMTAHAATLENTTTTTTTHKAKKHKKQNQAIASQQSKAVAPTEVIKNSQPMQSISFARQGGLPAGLYVSGQVGYADTHMKSQLPPKLSSSLANDGLAGRLAMGYKLNQNFAVEVGYLQLQEGKETIADGTLFNKQNAIDVVGKGILPITHNVNLYGKLGVAYLTTKLDDEYTTASGLPATNNLNGQLGIARHTWAPEVAVGMGYDITPNVSVDTSFTHIHPMGSDRPGNIDFLAVGVGYTFG